MCRAALSALIVISGMVGAGTGAVAAFDAISDPHRPAHLQRSSESATEGIGSPKDAPNAGDPASVPPAPSTGGTPPSEAPAPDAPATAAHEAPEPDVVQPTNGVLSDAFTELGIDDPTTPDVDESAPSPCTGLATGSRPVACVLR